MRRHLAIFTVSILAGSLSAGGAFAAQDATAAPAGAPPGDPKAGETVFRQCTACHGVGPDATNRMGPVLNGVLGRTAGTLEGFGYSDAMKAAGEEGLVWTPETVEAFVADPHGFVPGTKMPALHIKDETKRKDLVAYLATVSPDFDPEKQVSAYAPPD